jgi:hypothetical protein
MRNFITFSLSQILLWSQNQEELIGWDVQHEQIRWEIIFLSKNVKERDCLWDLLLVGNVPLKWVLGKQDLRPWIGPVCLLVQIEGNPMSNITIVILYSWCYAISLIHWLITTAVRHPTLWRSMQLLAKLTALKVHQMKVDIFNLREIIRMKKFYILFGDIYLNLQINFILVLALPCRKVCSAVQILFLLFVIII